MGSFAGPGLRLVCRSPATFCPPPLGHPAPAPALEPEQSSLGCEPRAGKGSRLGGKLATRAPGWLSFSQAPRAAGKQKAS